LGDIGGSSAVQTLLSYVRHPQPEIRAAAASALGSTGDSTALGTVREILHDPAPEVRAGAAEGLGHCGSAGIPDLLELLKDLNDRVRYEAVCSLGKLCALRPVPASMEPLVPELIDGLLSVLQDDYDQVRYFAAEALEKLCDPRSIPGLIAA